MRYRTKIYFTVLIVATISASLGLSVLYQEASRFIKFELRTKVVSVAATTSALIDPELVKKVSKNLDKNSPDFLQLQRSLIEARDNNRRPDIFVKYLYILKPLESDPKQMIFVAEAQNAVLPGDKDDQQNQSHVNDHLEEFYSPMTFIRDKWGVWMSGFAPIVDASGNYVATIGVDISAASAEQGLRKILRYSFYAFLSSLGIAYVLAKILSHRMTQSLNDLSQTAHEIGKGNLSYQARLGSDDEFGALAKAINEMSEGLIEREKLKNSFSRYVSKFVMDQILSKETSLKLQGERKKITILFSDIRQFSQLSENLSPEEIVAMLNEYFELMLNIIFRNQGTLDKFIGDGIMVEFGAPLPDHAQEIHAVTTALEMQKELKILCEAWKKKGKPTFHIGIGIHTGFAIVGNIGSEKRMEYTAIGDAVNIASRLEQATKTFKESILISEETFSGLNGKFSNKLLGPVALPGRTQETTVYAIYEKEKNS